MEKEREKKNLKNASERCVASLTTFCRCISETGVTSI